MKGGDFMWLIGMIFLMAISFFAGFLIGGAVFLERGEDLNEERERSRPADR